MEKFLGWLLLLVRVLVLVIMIIFGFIFYIGTIGIRITNKILTAIENIDKKENFYSKDDVRNYYSRKQE
jgi:hypothetical protein